MPIIFVRKSPYFTSGQMNRLANIFDNAGQVFLGVAVLSPIITSVDNTNFIVIILGLISVLFCWTLSLWFIRKAGDFYDF